MKGDGGDESRDSDACTTRDAGEGPSSPDKFRLGDIVEVFSHPRRQEALSYLATCESEVALEELARQIGPSCTVIEPLCRSYGQGRDVKLELYHVHIPKLADEGMVRFDRQRLTVSITEDGLDALRYL